MVGPACLPACLCGEISDIDCSIALVFRILLDDLPPSLPVYLSSMNSTCGNAKWEKASLSAAFLL